jgi:DNA-binding transcriptional MerR regulator
MKSDDEPGVKPSADKLWISITDLARELGVHPDTVRRWERTGVIPPALRRRGRRVYSKQDVDAIEQVIFSRKPGEAD